MRNFKTFFFFRNYTFYLCDRKCPFSCLSAVFKPVNCDLKMALSHLFNGLQEIHNSFMEEVCSKEGNSSIFCGSNFSSQHSVGNTSSHEALQGLNAQPPTRWHKHYGHAAHNPRQVPRLCTAASPGYGPAAMWSLLERWFMPLQLKLPKLLQNKNYFFFLI